MIKGSNANQDSNWKILDDSFGPACQEFCSHTVDSIDPVKFHLLYVANSAQDKVGLW